MPENHQSLTLHVSLYAYPNYEIFIKIAAFYGPEGAAKEQLINELRQACKEFGFFQLINHTIPVRLQESVLQQSKEFFDLPSSIKEKYSQGRCS